MKFRSMPLSEHLGQQVIFLPYNNTGSVSYLDCTMFWKGLSDYLCLYVCLSVRVKTFFNHKFYF